MRCLVLLLAVACSSNAPTEAPPAAPARTPAPTPAPAPAPVAPDAPPIALDAAVVVDASVLDAGAIDAGVAKRIKIPRGEDCPCTPPGECITVVGRSSESTREGCYIKCAQKKCPTGSHCTMMLDGPGRVCVAND